MNAKDYTYSVFYSPEDEAYVATVKEFPGLSDLEETQEAAFAGIVDLVQSVLDDPTYDSLPLPCAFRELATA